MVIAASEMSALPPGTAFLLVDDAIYSGEQMSSRIGEMCSLLRRLDDAYEEKQRQVDTRFGLRDALGEWIKHPATLSPAELAAWTQALQPNVFVVAPYVRARGAEHVAQTEGCNVRVFFTHLLPTIDDLIADEDVRKAVDRELRVHGKMSTTYFQFRLPDSRSIPDELIAEGHFVRGCEGSRRCPYSYFTTTPASY
jgi:hypothetical protein